jgi:GNAT superfamily N-acetyltransferase
LQFLEMQIRTATETDIPAIIGLLKISLGESLMPKSERYWRWKHLDNPFGNSPVLLSWEGETLVGIRAFMRWEWTYQGKIYSALRAVDTATHPEHQGKGIFKKLTLSLIDLCKEKGDHFIFNTPNEQSKPGYLKMGWQEAGKLPIVMSVQKPLKMLTNVLFQNDKNNKDVKSQISYYLEHPQLPALIREHNRHSHVGTNVSVPYLKWRYLNVPVARYVAIGEEQGGELKGLLIARIKKSRLGQELRVTDCFIKPAHGVKGLMHKMREFKKLYGVDYSTISGLGSQDQKQMVGRFRWKAPFGPTVTIRSLSLTDLGILQNFNHWSPSLGDLELF